MNQRHLRTRACGLLLVVLLGLALLPAGRARAAPLPGMPASSIRQAFVAAAPQLHVGVSALTSVSTVIQADGSLTVTGSLLGAQFLLNFPAGWNGQLVLFAHGYTAPGTPGGLDLVPPAVGTFGLAPLLSAEGYAYGYSMYSKLGYAVQAGILDTNLLRLIGRLIFHASRVLIVGASMGGDIVMGLIERFPHAFAGAGAACGAVAGWYEQIRYEFDFMVVYNYFTAPYGAPLALPTLLGAGNVITPNPSYTPAAIQTSVGTLFTQAQSNPTFASIIGQIANVTRANPDLVSFADALGGGVSPGLDDYLATSGGNGYSNIGTVYSGSLDDAALNAGVARIPAVAASTAYLNANYTPTGAFDTKLLTIHNLIDPVVPFSSEAILKARVAAQGNSANLSQQVVDAQPIATGGPSHCYFSPSQIAFAWGELQQWVNNGVKPTDGLNITND
jgi:hypothetical protein